GRGYEALVHQAEQLLRAREEALRAAGKDQRLLAALLDALTPQETAGVGVSRERILKGSRPDADDRYAAAFREYGLDVDALPVAAAAAHLRNRPDAVQAEVVAALDAWAEARRQRGRPEAQWCRPADLAVALDGDPRRA